MEKLNKAAVLKTVRKNRVAVIIYLCYIALVTVLFIRGHGLCANIFKVILCTMLPFVTYFLYRVLVIYAVNYHKIMTRDDENIVIANSRYYIAVPLDGEICEHCELYPHCQEDGVFINCSAKTRKDKQDKIFKRV